MQAHVFAEQCILLDKLKMPWCSRLSGALRGFVELQQSYNLEGNGFELEKNIIVGEKNHAQSFGRVNSIEYVRDPTAAVNSPSLRQF